MTYTLATNFDTFLAARATCQDDSPNESSLGVDIFRWDLYSEMFFTCLTWQMNASPTTLEYGQKYLTVSVQPGYIE